MDARNSEHCLTNTQNTLNWPGNEGIIEFGAAVTLLERLLAVTDIEEKALMNGNSSFVLCCFLIDLSSCRIR